jgi:hypothetical protein
MALDFTEFQKIVESASKADATKTDLRKALKKIESALTGLQVAVGEVEHIISDDYQPATKQKVGRKPKAVGDAADSDTATHKKPGRPKKAATEAAHAE